MRQHLHRIACAAALAALAVGAAHAQGKAAPKAQDKPAEAAGPERAQQDRMDLEGSKIIGNRELPKVLYIVPWKKPSAGDLSGRPLVSVLDEAMAPVDRDVFRRQVNYDGQTQAQAAQAKAAAAPATPAK